MSKAEIDELFSLYRLVSSDLNLAQTRTANSSVLEYLEALVSRAYTNLSIPRQHNVFKNWWNIVRHRFPAAMRSEAKLLAFTAIVFLSGILFGFFCTMVSPNTAAVFLCPSHLSESPSQRVAELEELERNGNSRINSVNQHASFTTFLFTHNIRVTVLGFALGLTFGIGTTIILFYNGAMLGSIACRYFEDGVFTFFIGWVGPHGSIELPCIIFGCTAGFMLSRAMFQRSRGGLSAQLKSLRVKISNILIGTASLLVVAGFIEGGFSQINEPTIPYSVKITVAFSLFIALLAYLFKMPVKQDI